MLIKDRSKWEVAKQTENIDVINSVWFSCNFIENMAKETFFNNAVMEWINFAEESEVYYLNQVLELMLEHWVLAKRLENTIEFLDRILSEENYAHTDND